MGYTTEFDGNFALTPSLTPDQIAVLNAFADERHEDYQKEGKPDYYCQWVPDEGGTLIQWDGNEKFYGYVEWIKYMIKHFFNPWGVMLNGVVAWEGEERGDTGSICIKNNIVLVQKGAKAMNATHNVPRTKPTETNLLTKVGERLGTPTLAEATEEQLRAALKNLEAKKNAPPAPIANPNFSSVIASAADYVSEIVKTGWSPEDSKQYIFEAVMTAIYGPDYFKWQNKASKG